MNPFDVEEHDLTRKIRKAANAAQGSLTVGETGGHAIAVSGRPEDVAAFRASYPGISLGSRVFLRHAANPRDKKPRHVWAAVVWYALPRPPAPVWPEELPGWARPPDSGSLPPENGEGL